ncbi:VanZ family protein [Neorhizobium lilium]|uniref:VanZ family protein n=1 Tax=Neorhizobium lilium TaxID=2503024 RepID=UPI00315D8DD5
MKIVAWLSLLAIVFVTVSPIGWRPHDYLPVDLDRALAFALMTLLFVMAYPRHFVLCSVLLIFGALAIEALQLLSPTRHAHMDDAAVKAAGAAFGAVVAWLINQVRPGRPAQVGVKRGA